MLLPVSQSTTARAAVLIGASSSVALHGAPILSALPDVHTAAAGWGVHVARGPRFSGPDRTVNERLQAAIGGTLLAAEPLIADPSVDARTRAVSARAFDAAGLHAEAGALLEGIDEFQRRGGLIDDGRALTDDPPLTSALIIDALTHHAWVTQESIFAETLAPAVTAAVEALLKAVRKDRSRALLLACLGSLDEMFLVAGDPRAAQQARSLWERFESPWPMPIAPLPPLPAVSFGAAFVPDEPLRLADVVRRAIDAVSIVLPGGVVDLFPGFDSGWLGASFDVRNVPVAGGYLSCAVRWHGERPALLWEVSGDVPIRLTCSSLDSSWSASGHGGDALLGAPSRR
jgi:hypothetical protein